MIHKLFIHFLLDLFDAVGDNDEGKVKQILDNKKVKIDSKHGKHGETALHAASKNENVNICELLIENGAYLNSVNDKNDTPLHISSQKGSIKIYTLLSGYGADLYRRGNESMSVLDMAAKNGHLNLCKILLEKDNFDVNVTDDHKRIPLHFSAMNGCCELFQFLLDMGSVVDLKANDGCNCLHIAAGNGHLSLYKRLLENHSFNVNMADDDGWTPLHFSARNGDYDLFQYFLDKGSNIFLKTKDESNCLQIAADEGHLDFCKILLEKSIFDVNMTDVDGWTPLHFSARDGEYELFQFFLDNGSDLSLTTEDGSNCLHIAADEGHLSFCEALLERDFYNVHAADDDGWAPLHYSARNGSYDLFRFFCNKGSDPYLKTNDGCNRLHIAADDGHLEFCRALIEKHNFRPCVTDKKKMTPLHHSTSSGNHELFKFFADITNDIYCEAKNGGNCLHIAAFNGHLTLCEELLGKYKFAFNIADNDGLAPLHYSASSGNYKIFKLFADMTSDIYLKTKSGANCLHMAAMNGHLDLCKTLLEKHNFNVKMADNHGRKPLHYSAMSGSYELCKFFLENGSDIYMESKDGCNCFHFAANNGHLKFCKTLLEKHKFDVHMTDNYGWTPLHYSAKNGNYELFKFLNDMSNFKHLAINAGCNCLHIAADSGHISLCKVLIAKHKFNVQMTDLQGWTALHYSAKNGSYELFQLLDTMGGNIYLKSYYGRNCLHIAADNGHINLCRKLLEKHDFDIHMTDNGGWTPLHFSIKNGSFDLFKYLLDMGSNVYLTTRNGSNCLHIAAWNGHLNLCKTFVEEYNFDVLVTDDNGWAPLHCVGQSGNYELFLYFLQKGSELYCKTKYMGNIVHIAAFFGHVDICEYVLKEFAKDFELYSKKEQYALNGKLCNSQIIFKYKVIFLHAKDENGDSFLHCAARGNQAAVCKLLLKYDIDVTWLNKKDETARDIAMQYKYEEVLEALKLKYEKPGMFYVFSMMLSIFFNFCVTCYV